MRRAAILREADERFLASLTEELAPLLGPTVAVRGWEIERRRGPRARLVAHLETPVGPWPMAAEAATLVAAAGDLIRRAPEERVSIAFRELVGMAPPS
jgi:hypothetical protein